MEQWIAQWIRGNNAGEGYHVGPHDVEGITPEAAAGAEGWTILERAEEGSVLCRTPDGRVIAIGDSHGPWGVTVAYLCLGDGPDDAG